MHPESCPILIKEGEAINAVIIVVDVDLSDLVQRIRWYHKSVLSLWIPISLSRPGTIGQDEVVCTTKTIFIIVFKAHELTNRPRLEPRL
jgi:hypothetical protein